jgi:hypothetical protein
MTDTQFDKLANIADSANNYTHPSSNGGSHIPANGTSGQFLSRAVGAGTAEWVSNPNTNTNKYLSDITRADNVLTFVIANGIDVAETFGSNAFNSSTIYYTSAVPNATTSTPGLMTDTQFDKLANIADSANNYTHPSSNGGSHIPSGGEVGQFLTSGTGAGVAAWTANPNSNTNFYLSNITNSGNTYTWVMSGTTDRSIAFGSNAFNSTAFTTNTGTVTQVTAGTGMTQSGTTSTTLNVIGLTDGGITVTANNIAVDNTVIRTTITTNQTLTGTLTADDFIATSDIRLKNVTGPITNALDTVNKLNAIRYTWKDERDDKEHIGFSAQDVLELVPEAVYGSEETEYGISYGKLVPVLVEAIKELAAEVEALKKKVGG